MSTTQQPEALRDARWYMVNKMGMATLCANKADAEKEAADAQRCWPHMGPHRAVQLVDAADAQQESFDHGPQATSIEDAARDVGKWLNERPNRPLDLRHVAMLCAHAQPAVAQQPSVTTWVPLPGTLPEPGVPVLLDIGKKYPIRAMWAAKHTLEVGMEDDSGFGEYDETTDTHYCPEGWYEWNEHEDVHWRVDKTPMAWCELPTKTGTAQAAPQQATPAEPVHGDVLPPVGSRVFIRHGRDDDAHACTVTGYYAWRDLKGNKRLHRVFVRMVYEGTEREQARMLCDCYPTAEAALAEAAPVAVAGPSEFPHEQMDAVALARYKVAPSHESMLHRHAVVAGDGSRQLYIGREVECQNMARKFAGAFLDGAFAFHSMLAAAPTTQQAPQQDAASVDLKTMELAESVGLIGPASRTHDLHAAIQRFHDLICANATIKAAKMAAEAISEAAPQQKAQEGGE